ncbi:hypothetical protein [Enemella evansiae]|uniref:hypothetical protein n=1 Tax=Enemella evansiae TaxID=2016499 RepID=UPI00105EE69F|nr:hypothetical protein [Enemella evansiae]TDO89718.1 hypothetical protein C8D81_2602 [Enemella evansiae]
MELLLITQVLPSVVLLVGYLLLARSTRAAWESARQVLVRDGPGVQLLEEMQHRRRRAQVRAGLSTAAILIVALIALPLLASLLAARQDHGALTVTDAFRRGIGDLPFVFVLLYGLSILTALLVTTLIVGGLFGLRAGQRVLRTAGHQGPAAELGSGWGRSAVLLFGIAGAALSLFFGAAVFALAFSSAASSIACAQPGGSKCY